MLARRIARSLAVVLGGLLAAACSSSSSAPADAPPSAADQCADATRNGDETGVDCGGSCKRCDAAECVKNEDCSSGTCVAGKCGPSAGKTCGVGTATPCPNGGACQSDADCASEFCGDAGKCDAPTAAAHSDGRKNAGETDIDCGGASGKPCETGEACQTGADCTGACVNALCAPPDDTDGKKNGDETDVDCGGPTAKKCGEGKACNGDGDCGLGWCDATKCATPSSGDAKMNGTETDVDCGGAAQTFDGVTVPAAPRCALTKTCALDADCESTVCSDGKKCVEAPSCRLVHGGYTCGAGEFGAATHESCCKTLPVAGVTINTKQVYLDKYEITAGRVRAFVKAIKAQYGGVPDVQTFVKAKMAADPLLAAMYVGTEANDLPAKAAGQGQTKTFPCGATPTQFDPDPCPQSTVTIDMGLESQIGPTSFYRGVQVNGTSGCGMYTGSYGHRTYWFDMAESAFFGEIQRPANQQDVLDEKSMNCMPPTLFAAFCAWDGGYLVHTSVLHAAWGAQAWPWGDTPSVTDETAKRANFNPNTAFNPAANDNPRYLFPVVNYATFANDFTPIIAAPGRFPNDIASVTRPGQESWMDLGGNMIEWSWNPGDSRWKGWTGSSFEGHNYGKSGASNVYYLDKYGKGGARCMRLK